MWQVREHTSRGRYASMWQVREHTSRGRYTIMWRARDAGVCLHDTANRTARGQPSLQGYEWKSKIMFESGEPRTAKGER
jgi:hypothetical protein